MATYVYTGNYRAKTLVVKRLDTGSQNSYNFLNSFTYNNSVYPALTDNDLAVMDEVTYQNRLAAFYSWVETQETGLDVGSISIDSAFAPYGSDPNTCPAGVEYTPQS